MADLSTICGGPSTSVAWMEPADRSSFTTSCDSGDDGDNAVPFRVNGVGGSRRPRLPVCESPAGGAACRLGGGVAGLVGVGVVAVQPGVEFADLVGVAAESVTDAFRTYFVAAPAVEGDDVDADVVGGVVAPQ